MVLRACSPPRCGNFPMTLNKLTMPVEWDLQRALGCDGPRGVRGGLVAERGHEIIAAGATCRQIFRLSSGLTYRARPLCVGGQAILDVYRPGDFIGLDGLFCPCARHR